MQIFPTVAAEFQLIVFILAQDLQFVSFPPFRICVIKTVFFLNGEKIQFSFGRAAQNASGAAEIVQHNFFISSGWGFIMSFVT